MCFYYISVMFCINIHFSLVLISFAWFKVIRAQIVCIIVCFQKLIIHGRNADAIGLQKMEKNLATKELKQIWNSAVAVATIVVAILEQQQRKFCSKYLEYCDLQFPNLEDSCPKLPFTLIFNYKISTNHQE